MDFVLASRQVLHITMSSRKLTSNRLSVDTTHDCLLCIAICILSKQHGCAGCFNVTCLHALA